MSESRFAALALILMATILKAGDKAILPGVISHARYVAVTTYDGDVYSSAVSPDDRQAVSDVVNALEKWGRYRLVYGSGEAELLFVVRKGRAVEARLGVQLGHGTAQSAGGRVGDPLDTLEVYDGTSGIHGSPLWKARAADGLTAPELPLLKQFRAKVEASVKKKP